MSELLETGCLACDVLAGRVKAPGDAIYVDRYWTVDHSTSPVILAGFLIIKPNRHVEHLAELTRDEMTSFATILRLTCRAVANVLRPEKIYTCSFGEGEKHVHFYVVPRMTGMPANGFEVLSRMFDESPWAATDEEAAEVADRVRVEMRRLLLVE